MTRAPLLLTEPIPHVCLVADVLRILRMSRRTFDRLMAAKRLPLVELPTFGGMRRFSGESVRLIVRSPWAPASARHARRAS